MSKKDQPSKYLASFYSNPGGQAPTGTSGSSHGHRGAPTINHAPTTGSSVNNVPKGGSTADNALNNRVGSMINSAPRGVPPSIPAANSFQNVQKISPGNSRSGRNMPFTPKVGGTPSSTSSKPFPSVQKSPTRLSSPSFDADKFKKPGEFFKSSQSTSSQITSSENKMQVAKRTSFGGGGSTHEMLSQSFQVKKPQMGGNMLVGSQMRPMGGKTGPMGDAKPPFGFNAKLPVAQRKSHIAMDKDVASTYALQLQWTQKMGQKKDSLAGNLDKRTLTRNEGKSPLGKSFWADTSFSKPKETCKNQQNDPWYSNDVWGDDLPADAVDACLLLATQEAQKPGSNNDPLSSWMNESWASPKKSDAPAQPKPISSVKTALFTEKKFPPCQTSKSEDLMDLLAAGDEDFFALVDKVESQPKPAMKASKPTSSYRLSGKVSFPSQPLRPNLPGSSQVRSIVPLSERMPVGSGNKNSFVIKAKEFESPSKHEKLSHSQRTFRKPVKSLPSPTTTKMSFTTEWLRGQLEKISSEYTTLKEDVQVKEGESKLLREKLKTAEEEAQKHKLDKARELERLRQDYETKVKQLEKQLEATQTQAMFKAREAESSLEKYRELKNISVRTPEPAKCQSFKNIPSIGPKAGELAKAEVLADETIVDEESDKLGATASADFINDTINVFETPKKVVEPTIYGTPEESMFEDSPVKSKENLSLPCPMLSEPKIPQKTYVLPKQSIFDRDFIRRNEVFKNASEQVVHGKQPKKELNHFLMHPMEYLPHTLLQTEFSEQDVENYLVRRPTLVELWGVPYDAFGEAVLDDYEKTVIGDKISADPARIILSKSRYFSSMESVHGCLVTLADSIRWGPPEWKMAKNVVDLATTMVRELYATLGDPRLLRTTYTIYDRDPKILSEFQDSSELIKMFDPLSSEKWKNESFVELRRCLVMISFLCSVDHMTARYIINPKAYISSRAREFYPTSQDLSQASKKSEDDNFAVKITVKEGERKPSELKLMQMYRDLHSKKLTLAADLANSFTSDKSQPVPLKITFDLTVPMEVGPEYENCLIARKALQTALENSEKNSSLRSGTFPSSSKFSNATTVRFDDFKKCVSQLGLTLEESSVKDVVRKIQGDLNPQKVVMLNKMTEKIDSDESQIAVPYHVSVPERLFEAVESEVLGVSCDCGILGAPVNKCITLLEKQMMQLALLNNKSLKNMFERSVGQSAPIDLDLTRYVSSCADADADYEVTRKRKMSVEDMEPRKTMKVADYETPPFDKTLYTQILKEPEDGDVVMITESQGPNLPIEDEQLAKFEKREEMAELKRKMLAEEKKESKRHSLAPIRIPGRNSPTNEDSADREVAMEIEKMFQSQVRPDLQMDEPHWSSESEDGGSNDGIRTLSTNDDNVVIEVIPELVKHFHNKLNNAGLLELLCEIFKEGGVLRFTHRLNGVMLGTVVMLQKLVMYQRREVEPCQSKLATIIREILYTRPSPRIVLEVNILLRYAVTLTGFTKLLCHNASPETFVTSHELVYFTRGACLLEVLCILVTYATEEDTDYTVYLEMIHWVYYIICTEKKHMAGLYEQHNTFRRRCMCITALNNTIVMIFHRALTLYRRLTDTRMKSPLKRHLEKIFISGLQVLRQMYSYGSLSFLYTIRTQYLEYRQLLNWLRDMHDCAIYEGFHLSPAYLYIVAELLKDTRDPNNIQKPPETNDQPDLGKYFFQSKSWPYDLETAESTIKADSSESEEE